jgi:hypothetical protein
VSYSLMRQKSGLAAHHIGAALMNTCATVVKSFVLDVRFRGAAEHAQTAATGAKPNVRSCPRLRWGVTESGRKQPVRFVEGLPDKRSCRYQPMIAADACVGLLERDHSSEGFVVRARTCVPYCDLMRRFDATVEHQLSRLEFGEVGCANPRL